MQSVRRILVLLPCVFGGGPIALGQAWEPAGTLPTGGQARRYAAGVSASGVLYAIGGTPWQNGGDQDGCVHYFAAGAWKPGAALDGAGPVIGGAAGVDALGRIIIYGGYIDGDDGPGPEQVYDPVQGLQTSIAQRSAPQAAVGYLAWAADDQGRLYGCGGGPGAGGPNSGYCDRYDATTDSWTALAPLPTPAADACAAYDGAGHVLVIGGIDATGTARLANVARYDVATDSWSDAAVPDYPLAISGARAVLGADGRIYVVGGTLGPIGGELTTTAVYKLEPATGTWVAVAPLSTPRRHFACVRGDDDYMYAIGGDNELGGTASVERLFTPRCPEITGPSDQVAYAGSVAGFTVVVGGAPPFTYQWRKDGVPLSDGATGNGSSVDGATTETLRIVAPGFGDAGDYDVLVSNACGTVASAVGVLTVVEPPALPGAWTVAAIHPPWADGASYAYGITDGWIGGAATLTTTLPDGRVMSLSHPILWDMPTRTPADITPPGSIGGAVLDAEGELLVGWFWHTYPCWGGGQWWTCAWQSAGYWWADTLNFIEVHMSGAEFDSVAATDGTRMVSNAAFEYTEGFYDYRPYLWTPPQTVAYLDPGAAAERPTVNTLDGPHQFGSMVPPGGYADYHAAMWSGSGASMAVVHPSGYATSSISGAGDGQAVGYVSNGAQHAALWAAGSAVAVELHRAEWSSSHAQAARGGVQVGVAPGGAALWIGAPGAYVNLGAILPAGFVSSTAEDVSVGADGVITVVGHGYNTLSGREEALVWQSVSLTLADFLACLSGPDAPPACDEPGAADGDADADVDLRDYLALQRR